MRRRLSFWHFVAEALVVAATVVALLTTGDGANTGIIEDGLGSPGSVYVVVFIVLAVPALVVGLIDGALARRQGGIMRRAIRAPAIVAFGALAAYSSSSPPKGPVTVRASTPRGVRSSPASAPRRPRSDSSG